MTSILATAVAPMRSRLRDLLERPGTRHTIVALTFTMLNLFIAIIVNAMQRYSDAESKGDTADQGGAGVREELRALSAQIERLSASLAAHGGREGVAR